MADRARAQANNWLANMHGYFWGEHGEQGVDIQLPYATPVYAPVGGLVEQAGVDPCIGGVVEWVTPLKNYSGLSGDQSLYIQHLSQYMVQPGQYINPGDFIGYSGGQNGYGNNPSQAACSTGPHIEFGINSRPQGRKNYWQARGANVNPLAFIQAIADGSIGKYLGSGPVGGQGNCGPAPNPGDTSKYPLGVGDPGYLKDLLAWTQCTGSTPIVSGLSGADAFFTKIGPLGDWLGNPLRLFKLAVGAGLILGAFALFLIGSIGAPAAEVAATAAGQPEVAGVIAQKGARRKIKATAKMAARNKARRDAAEKRRNSAKKPAKSSENGDKT